jgi:4-oxalocrotonate tautomerase
MPIVTIRTIKGILTKDKKAELHKRITDLLVEIEGEGKEEFRQLVVVTIDEDEPEHFSMGGIPASKELIDALLGR